MAAPIIPYLGIRIIFTTTFKQALASTCFNTSFSNPAATRPVENGRLKNTNISPSAITLNGRLADRYSPPSAKDIIGPLKTMIGRTTNMVKNKEFYVVTPFFLLELVSKWRYSQLKDHIEEFYLKFTDKMLSNEDLDDKIDSMSIDDEKILEELKNKGIKGEEKQAVLSR